MANLLAQMFSDLAPSKENVIRGPQKNDVKEISKTGRPLAGKAALFDREWASGSSALLAQLRNF